MKLGISYGLCVLGLCVAAYACSKQERPSNTPGASASSSDASQTTKDKARDVNRAIVRTGDEVERGVRPATDKLNQGADTIDSALKGK
ncbi:MAG TPA: hypothetical protein VKP30_18610 [Polyangiaceae bacterium]|nr:hypothetical protein [Polyangiaceae bacterium]